MYVLGGYDDSDSKFLSSCEKYDLEKDEWKPIDPMTVAKCAFGACTVGGRYIYVIGGYDGVVRLDIIERYDTEIQKWEV